MFHTAKRCLPTIPRRTVLYPNAKHTFPLNIKFSTSKKLHQDEKHQSDAQTPQQEKPSLLSKLFNKSQSFLQKYGKLGLQIYTLVYVLTLCTIFMLLHVQGFSLVPLFRRLNEWNWVSTSTLEKVENQFDSDNWKSQIFISWIATEVMEPLRISLTVFLVSLILKRKK